MAHGGAPALKHLTLLVRLLFPVLVAACIAPQSEPCASARGEVQCPSGYVCLASGAGCASSEQLSACQNLPDGAACKSNVPSISSGKCIASVCTNIVCGDGIVERGEGCDDGNLLDFTATGQPDGCSSDCRSTQACGNRITDWLVGELCDDGNTNDGDGCAANCRSTEACGNRVHDSGEMCDDGNNVGGDGCAANCRSDETCGNGVIDVALGEQCDDGANNSELANANCRRSCRLRHCGDGVIDAGEACDEGARNSNTDANACRTNCQRAYCGDGVRDANETCDDGNFAFGDGCSANCTSEETCGNGVIDTARGEQCDPTAGAFASHDGCSSVCRVEFEQWSRVPTQGVASVTSHVMAYDENRKQVVLFGGRDDTNGLRGSLWAFDGTGWQRLRTRHQPPPRTYAGLVYDSHRRRLVLYGGTDNNTTYYQDTWEYDGSDWQQIPTTHHPSALLNGTLVYDAARQQTLLFGGETLSEQGTSTQSDATWRYDGVDWQQVQSAHRPPPRIGARAVYDPVRRVVVMYGGAWQGPALDDAWQWDGTDWSLIANTITTPTLDSPDPAAHLFFDTAAQATTLLATTPGVGYAQRWQWQGAGWHASTLANPMPWAWETTGAYDAERRGYIVHGGSDAVSDGLSSQTWKLTDSEWHRLTLQHQPPASTVAYGYFDERRGCMVVLATPFSEPGPAQTWEFDGVNWHWRDPKLPALGPAWQLGCLTYNADDGRGYFFGGAASHSDTIASNELWAYDGQAWQQQATSAGPSARLGCAATYLRGQHRLMIFGGRAPDRLESNETWLFDGTSWQQILGAIMPPAQNAALLTYDERRQVAVLLAETTTGYQVWEFDGAQWQPRNVQALPPLRSTPSMFYDRHRGVVIFFSGYSPTSGAALADTWQYDGNAFVALHPLLVPARANAIIGYDARQLAATMWGGYARNEIFTDTWHFTWARSDEAPDQCIETTSDSDADGRYGCGATPNQPSVLADPDCWGRCTPACPPWTTFADAQTQQTLTWPAACSRAHPNAPYCGDNHCSALEDAGICPGDCL